MSPTRLCELCGKKAVVSVASGESPDNADIIVPAVYLCEPCGHDFIRSSPVRKRLTFAADQTDQPMLKRRYKVVGNTGHNETRVKVISPTNAGEREFSIRTDLIPTHARGDGAEFDLIGTQVEINLFEKSLGK